jgi:glyoxylase-like metal-dependent hydrolase (beta-lactamase superfamily II)
VLNLLAITFEAQDAPAGTITLHFSDGAAIQLEVECIEAQMKDLGPVWEAVATPGHPDGA